MPLVSKELEVEVSFIDNRVTKRTVVTPQEGHAAVSNISPHFLMLPVAVEGATLGPVERTSENGRIEFSGDKILLNPPLQAGQEFRYATSCTGEFGTNGTIQWPVRHPTEMIMFIFEHEEKPYDWSAVYFDGSQRQDGEKISPMTDGSVTVFEIQDPDLGSTLVFEWKLTENAAGAFT